MPKHIHIHLPARKTKDAETKYLLKRDAQVPPNEGWKGALMVNGNHIVRGSTVLYKSGSGYVPWYNRNATPMKFSPSDIQTESLDTNVKDSFPTKFAIRGRNYISAGKLRNNGEQACYEELDPNGARTGRMIWLTTTGQVVADQVKDSMRAYRAGADPKANIKIQFSGKESHAQLLAVGAKPAGEAGHITVTQEQYEKLKSKGLVGDLTKDTRDSEENDAFIQGYKDAMKGKQPDPAFHPGGEKKPAVTAKYAAGHKQGTTDLAKKKSQDDGPASQTLGIRG